MGDFEANMPSALDRWYEAHPDARDHPRISVWMPSEAPTADLQTSSVYEDGRYICEKLDDPDRPMANLRLAGITFGGPLSELEEYLAAAREALSLVRDMVNRLAAAPLPTGDKGAGE